MYCITNNINGKKYIGQTQRTVERRMKDHICSPHLIGKSIRKHGILNFSVETIATASTIEELNKLEAELIAHYNTLVPNGYNLNYGGDANKISEITKLKISQSRKNPTLNLPLDCQIIRRSDSKMYRLRIYTLNGRISCGSFRTFKQAYKRYRQIKRGRLFTTKPCEIDFQTKQGWYRLRVVSDNKRITLKSGFKTKHEAFAFYYGVA